MAARRGPAPGRISPVEVGARRSALKKHSRNATVTPRVQVSEMQRSRLLGAAVVAVDELGWSRVTVEHVTGRARVSRRTFYDMFDNCEDCLLAVLEDAVDLIAAELGSVNLDALPWRERVRTGLWGILSFFDREPVFVRVSVVESARGSQRVLERRGEIFKDLATVIDEGRHETAHAADCRTLTAEGLVGAVQGIVYKRLLTGEHEPLSDLLGELMGLIVLPYLGPAAARRERDRPPPSSSEERGSRDDGRRAPVDHDPLRDVPMRLTYRTARVLEVIAEHPGASNRVVGEHAGISDQGQVSKLLARLGRLGLLANAGEGQPKGEPNVWQLTPKGEQVERSIHMHTHDRGQAA